MIVTDILHTLIEHSTLNPLDKGSLHEDVESLIELGITAASEKLNARREAAAQAEKDKKRAELQAQLAALEEDTPPSTTTPAVVTPVAVTTPADPAPAA
jgi:hypothetical protein